MKRIKLIILSTALASMIPICVKAQLNPMGAQYFQNQYLGNPAMAGIEEGLHLKAGLRQLWTSIPGAPVSQTLTADYRMNGKVGLGINLYNDEAGLLKRTSVAATYAYHLPLNSAHRQLHFGLSLGLMYEGILNERIQGEQGDLSVNRFNQRETVIDGDFGAAYTSGKLTLQTALPNLKRLMQNDEHNTVDRAVFFTAASYKFIAGMGSNTVIVEPKVVFRGVKGYRDMWDAGSRIVLAEDRLFLTGMYHSSESATFGMGIKYEALRFTAMYTTETSVLTGYTGGNFEIGLQYSFFPNKK